MEISLLGYWAPPHPCVEMWTGSGFSARRYWQSGPVAPFPCSGGGRMPPSSLLVRCCGIYTPGSCTCDPVSRVLLPQMIYLTWLRRKGF